MNNQAVNPHFCCFTHHFPMLFHGCIPKLTTINGGKKNMFHQFVIITISGWWCNNHLEKYSSMGRIIPYMLGFLFPIDGKIKKSSKPPTTYGGF